MNETLRSSSNVSKDAAQKLRGEPQPGDWRHSTQISDQRLRLEGDRRDIVSDTEGCTGAEDLGSDDVRFAMLVPAALPGFHQIGWQAVLG